MVMLTCVLMHMLKNLKKVTEKDNILIFKK